MKKIGILGGTFDPIHKGHIELARDAGIQQELDQVFFMPAKIQPFKQDREVSSEEHRLAMLRLVVEKLNNSKNQKPIFSVSTLEMDMEGVSYTYKTLRKVREMLEEDDEIFFIIGTDSFIKLDTWKNAEELLTNNNFIVATRPGYKDEETQICKKRYKELYDAKMIFIHNRQYDISSTHIKELIEHKQPINNYVLEEVEQYIYDNKLYG